ncbi:MAG TPA: hypothetical protein VM364_18795 [Vicinamibacterales bacterium]|nr:hypothetical protein [Vicinamibacterales bacterium]
MSMHDPYTVKAVEYLTGLAFLLLFVLFWRYVNGERVAEQARAWSGQLAEWFRVPEHLHFHPGHGWARTDAHDVLTLGLDDFAQQLVGRVEAVDLPRLGAVLTRGNTGWTLHADGKAVDMMAPAGGTVVAVNADVKHRAELVNQDPYGRGWLLKVRVPRVTDAVKDLVTGQAARQWIARVSDDLMASMTPELGHLCQDGGLPVHGIARGIDDERWDEVARHFLHPPVA